MPRRTDPQKPFVIRMSNVISWTTEVLSLTAQLHSEAPHSSFKFQNPYKSESESNLDVKVLGLQIWRGNDKRYPISKEKVRKSNRGLSLAQQADLGEYLWHSQLQQMV